ncbi:hypothetical protein Hanom_Chr12g01131731 [Helianthus anomalus]
MKPVHQSLCCLFGKAVLWDVCRLKPSRLPVATLFLCLGLYAILVLYCCVAL